MDIFQLPDLKARQQANGKQWLEFIRHESLSAGLYVIPAGGVDPQQPHTEDEMYYVISGRGKFFCGGQEADVTAGTTLFVAKGVEHRFHDIAEELVIMVFFAPPEGSQSQ
jgi:mannose-6-phosphate isomerase-like protein (cupin superfamily)